MKRKRVFPKRLAKMVARFLHNKLAEDIVIIDVRKVLPITSFFVIATGTSERHIKNLSRDLIEELEKRGYEIFGKEGIEEGRWALIDAGDVVVHIFLKEVRAFYDIEGLWADCPSTSYPDAKK